MIFMIFTFFFKNQLQSPFSNIFWPKSIRRYIAPLITVKQNKKFLLLCNVSMAAIYKSTTAISFCKKLVLLIINILLYIHFTLYTFYVQYKVFCLPSVWLNVLSPRRSAAVLTQLTFQLVQIYILFIQNMNKN